MPDRRTGIVVTNPYDGPGSPALLTAALTVFNADGESRSGGTVSVEPNGMRQRLPRRDGPGPRRVPRRSQRPRPAPGAVPGVARRELRGVRRRRASHREPRHHRPDLPAGRGCRASWLESAPVASVLVLGSDRETVLTLPNVWGPVAGDCDVEVRVFAPNGDAACSRTRSWCAATGWSRSGSRSSSPVHGVAATCRSRTPRFGCRREGGGEGPATFDVLVGFFVHGELAGEVQVGAEYFNAAVPPGVRFPDVRRTRVFAADEVGRRCAVVRVPGASSSI